MRSVAFISALLWAHPAVADDAAPAPVDINAPGTRPMDFDLLGAPAATAPAVSDGKLKARRVMLQLHQGMGIALIAATLGAVVFGQLNYSDRFQGPSTGRYELTHEVFAYTSFSLFLATGALAIFAPSPLDKHSIGFDRITLHRIGMYGAAVCMVVEVVLGIVTTLHEGLADQRGLAEAHLVNGYATAGLMTLGVGALVF